MVANPAKFQIMFLGRGKLRQVDFKIGRFPRFPASPSLSISPTCSFTFSVFMWYILHIWHLKG